MNIVRVWHRERLMVRTVKALEANFFKAAYFTEREDLLSAIISLVKPGMKVGFGGSVTIRQLGLIERLSGTGAILLDHWKEGLSPAEIQGLRIEHLTSDLFISGANAVTEKGEIVNIDGVGNRVNGMTFGPKKVVIVAGANKIVPSIDMGLDRIRRIAAPMNARRLNLKLPCAETGTCHDCSAEGRICRIISILQRRPSITDISVYLISEELGF
jgi:hypothetical protein